MEMLFQPGQLKRPAFNNKKQKKRERHVTIQEPNGYETNQTIVKNDFMPSSDLLQNQIQAACLAESLIDEIRVMEDSQTSHMSDFKTSFESFESHTKLLLEEKELLNHRVSVLTRTNEELKTKFSALLDHFQKYVSFAEQQKAKEDLENTQQHESLLQNMQDNVSELEQVTERLQFDLQHKEEDCDELTRENREL